MIDLELDEHLKNLGLERERRFKAAIQAVLDRGEHPSGARIRVELGINRWDGDGNLGSTETRWRREYLTSLGWTRGPGLAARWKPPEDS